MTQGKIQLAPQGPLEKRVITISRPQRPETAAETEDPLFMNVLRRRWLLLAFCGVLSAIAALLVAKEFSLPKATTTGKLRYVALPPTIKEVYAAPQALEIAEILKSNECMDELCKRAGVEADPKTLTERFTIRASRFTNIIDLELRWNDGKKSIEMVNELMRIACETTAAQRKETLEQYAIETDLQHEAADQRVMTLRDTVMRLRQERNAELSADGTLGSEANRLMSQIARAEDALADISLQRVALNRQLTTLRSDVEALHNQVKKELLGGRRQQLQLRKRLYPANSERYALLERAEQMLNEFEKNSQDLDFMTWRAKLEAIGGNLVPELDPATLAAVETSLRQMAFKQSKIDQVEVELIPMESQVSLLETRRETLERRLADFTGSSDISSAALEEGQAQLEEALAARSRLQDQLHRIRRGEKTEFNEMTILTKASWQTTETSQGKTKLFVFTFAGCFMALVLPVFALEHFFPSGDPAEHAAKSLGIPHVSKGTFVTHRLRPDRRKLHPVNSEAMRLLALRIQQSVHGPGSLVVFSGLDHEKSSIPMISYLAECLARREERVLIVDACERSFDESNGQAADEAVKSVTTPPEVTEEPAAASVDAPKKLKGQGAKTTEKQLPANVDPALRTGVVGLAEFLQRSDVDADDMICRTSIPGVDILPSGSTTFPREGLASSSLTSLFEECRQRYTMILVSGPSTHHPSDLQMLSARADGILFTVPPTSRPGGHGEDVVRDLLDLGAPVIGVVS